MTKRKEVRPLQVGERVRVYGNLKGGKEANGITATVAENSVEFGPGPGWITVAFTEDGVPFTKHVHPRQCVRLIKKPRPKPQERVGFRRHKWLNVFADSEYFLDSADEAKKWADSRNFIRTVHLVELAPGEVVVSRDDLAKAWGEAFGAGNVFKDALPEFLKALGLGAK